MYLWKREPVFVLNAHLPLSLQEDPFFPLFVAFRRHHASVRILVDLQLYYFGATLEDAVKIYEEELGFDRVTARSPGTGTPECAGIFHLLLLWNEENLRLGKRVWIYEMGLYGTAVLSRADQYGKPGDAG